MKPGSDRIEVFAGTDGQWYYRIRNCNRRVLCTSEGYTRRRKAVTMARNLATRHSTFGAVVVLDVA